MLRLRRFVKLSLIPMTLLLPIWLIVGRALLGSIGWLTLIMLFTVVPVLLISMIVLDILLLRRKDVRASKMVSVLDARLVTAFYISTFLFGIFMVDFGDTEDSIVSVASRLLGSGFLTISSILAVILGVLATGLLVASLVVAIMETVRSKRQPAPEGSKKDR
jgi:hypothetical protein